MPKSKQKRNKKRQNVLPYDKEDAEILDLTEVSDSNLKLRTFHELETPNTLSKLKSQQAGEKKRLKKEIKEIVREAKKFSKKDIHQKQQRKDLVKQTKEMLLDMEKRHKKELEYMKKKEKKFLKAIGDDSEETKDFMDLETTQVDDVTDPLSKVVVPASFLDVDIKF